MRRAALRASVKAHVRSVSSIWMSAGLLQLRSRRFDKGLPRIVRLPHTPDVRVSFVGRPAEPALAVQPDEARHAVICRAMDEYLLVVRHVHGIEEGLEISRPGYREIDGNVVVRHAE